MAGEPDIRRYVRELQAMLRLRRPAAYRAFLSRWRDLHQRGVADKLASMSDADLRLRIERMILDMPELADLHESARQYLAEHGGASPPPTAGQAPPAQRRVPWTRPRRPRPGR